jgi:hypothetical protein
MRDMIGTATTSSTVNETETTTESETAGSTTTIDNLRTEILVTETPETCAIHETQGTLTTAKGRGTTEIRVTGTSAVLETFAIHEICVTPAT